MNNNKLLSFACHNKVQKRPYELQHEKPEQYVQNHHAHIISNFETGMNVNRGAVQ